MNIHDEDGPWQPAVIVVDHRLFINSVPGRSIVVLRVFEQHDTIGCRRIEKLYYKLAECAVAVAINVQEAAFARIQSLGVIVGGTKIIDGEGVIITFIEPAYTSPEDGNHIVEVAASVRDLTADALVGVAVIRRLKLLILEALEAGGVIVNALR